MSCVLRPAVQRYIEGTVQEMIRGKVASSGMRLDHLMRGKTFGHPTKGNPRVWRMSSCTDNMNIQNPADGYKSDTLSLLVQVLTGPV